MENETKSRRSGVELAELLCSRLDVLRGTRAVWEPLWDELSHYILPRKADQIYRKTDSPSTAPNDQLFDTTAVFANQTLANGMLSYMTPADTRWFALDPPAHQKKSDKTKTWLQECTEVLQHQLASSNFYSEVHELYFNDGAYGTSSIVVLPGKQAALNFDNINLGSFWIDENDEGVVDTIFRELNLTARQCEQKFGEEKLSPKIREALIQFRKNGKAGQKFCVIHAIYPRTDDEREWKKMDGPNKPFASVYFVPAEKHVISNGGFDEKPFFASRHLKWGDSVYGYSPGWMALPEARQVNFLAKNNDSLSEVAAFPRILVPSSMVDEIDMRAGGVSVFNENNPNALPKEWLTGGRYDVGLDREKHKQSAIERAYHVDLFQMFANLDKQMTAREVAERTAEKLVQFTPAFARKTTELVTPLLRRCFGILLRAGMFPQPPQEAFDQTPEGFALPEPNVSYNSRVALAIKAMQNTAFYRTMESILPLSEVQPDILDNFDLDEAARMVSRNDGLPTEILRPIEDRDKIRQDRAQAMAEQAEQEKALAMSQAAKNVGGIKSDSVAAQALQQ